MNNAVIITAIICVTLVAICWSTGRIYRVIEPLSDIYIISSIKTGG